MFSSHLVKDQKGNPIKPLTTGQVELATSIEKNKITFALGPAGTGKSFVTMCMAIDMLRKKRVSKIVLTRPPVEAGKSLGFLPGDIDEKFEPYLKPFFEAMDVILKKDEKEKYFASGCIEIAPLGFLRGTTQDAFLILDEGQNCTFHDLQMVITRLGKNGKFVINGDPEQSDLKGGQSGLVDCMKSLKGIKGIWTTEMGIDDIVRDDIVKEAIIAFRSYKKNRSK